MNFCELKDIMAKTDPSFDMISLPKDIVEKLIATADAASVLYVAFKSHNVQGLFQSAKEFAVEWEILNL